MRLQRSLTPITKVLETSNRIQKILRKAQLRLAAIQERHKVLLEESKTTSLPIQTQNS